MYLTCFHSTIFTHYTVCILNVYAQSIHLICKCLQIQQFLKLPTSAYKKILTCNLIAFHCWKRRGGAEMLTHKGRGKGSNLIGSYISRARQPIHKRAFKYYVSREGGEGGLCQRLLKLFFLWQILAWRGRGDGGAGTEECQNYHVM